MQIRLLDVVSDRETGHVLVLCTKEFVTS